MLHRNLVYLATIADSNQNMQSLLPAVSVVNGLVRACDRACVQDCDTWELVTFIFIVQMLLHVLKKQLTMVRIGSFHPVHNKPEVYYIIND